MDSRIPFEREEARADQVPRRFVLPGKRLPGLIGLLLLPLVAALGLTSRQATINVEHDGLSLQVDYPRVQRYMNPRLLTISVSNLSSQPLADAVVNLSRAYLDSYSAVAMKPDVGYIDDADVVMPLGVIEPGETRRIRVELRSESYFFHSGQLTASSGGTEVVAELRSLVLP